MNKAFKQIQYRTTIDEQRRLQARTTAPARTMSLTFFLIVDTPNFIPSFMVIGMPTRFDEALSLVKQLVLLGLAC
jgi:hypothetical protein